MAISAMEFEEIRTLPTERRGDQFNSVQLPGLATTSQNRQAKLIYALEQVAQLRSSQFVTEESAAFNQAISDSLNLRPKNQEDVLKLADGALGILEAELKAGKSETLVKFLTAMSHFHTYSFSNMMLIAMQYPEATHVAGFQAWKQLGRFVKKGEQGIRILAPIVIKKKSENEPEKPNEQDKEKSETAKTVVGFKAVSVFDISQTDGEPLPDIGTVKGRPRPKSRKDGRADSVEGD